MAAPVLALSRHDACRLIRQSDDYPRPPVSIRDGSKTNAVLVKYAFGAKWALTEKHLEWGMRNSLAYEDQYLLNVLSAIEAATEFDRSREAVGLEVDPESPLQKSVDLAFDLLLDSLGVPAEGAIKTVRGERPCFSRAVRFSRRWFVCRFFSDYLIEKQERSLSLVDVLSEFRSEIAENADGHYI